MTRVLVLWKQRTGYLDASLRALKQIGLVPTLLTLPTSETRAATRNDFEVLGADYEHAVLESRSDAATVGELASTLQPQVILISGWDVPAYRLRSSPGRLRVLCMDNQWRATPRQWAGVAASPIVIRRWFDKAFVAGPRQADFAQRLGFRPNDVIQGLYAADTDHYTPTAEQMRRTRSGFVFVGRLVPSKGLDALLEGYRRYRQKERHLGRQAWPLHICGSGPLERLVDSWADSDIVVHGFLGADNLKSVLASCSALVVPSRFEPWGVVVHEAAAMGLGVIASHSVGSTEWFAREGANGFTFGVDRPDQIALALERFSGMSSVEISSVRDLSYRLAAAWTPPDWARVVSSMAGRG